MITFPNVKGIMTIRTQNGIINGHIDCEIPDDVTGRDCMLMSEPSLAKLWDTPEEDAAWNDPPLTYSLGPKEALPVEPLKINRTHYV